MSTLPLPKRRRFCLETITPVHIGSGEESDLASCIHQPDSKRLHVLDLDALCDRLEAEEVAETLAAVARQGSDLSDFVQRNHIALEDVTLYMPQCSSPPQRPIDVFIKHCQTEVYVPGSSLKGALRTILLWKVVQGSDAVWRKVEQRVREVTERRQRTSIAQPVEQFVFGSRANLDWLRSLHVVDTKPIHANLLCVTTVDTYEQTQTGFHKHDELSGLLVESLPAKTKLYGSLKVDEFLFSEQADKELHFRNRQRYVAQLVAHCNEFSEWLLGEEKAFYRRMRWDQTVQWCVQQQNWCAKQRKLSPDRQKECLLPLGWGAGWRAKTIGPVIQAEMPEEFELLFEYYLYRRGHGGTAPTFPITRKLTTMEHEDKRVSVPMGWVKISLL